MDRKFDSRIETLRERERKCWDGDNKGVDGEKLKCLNKLCKVYYETSQYGKFEIITGKKGVCFFSRCDIETIGCSQSRKTSWELYI